MRTRTKGIQLASDGSRSIDKQYRGERIFERLGQISQEDAEAWLRNRQVELDAQRENELRGGDEQLFAAAAAKYLMECQQRGARSLETISYHVSILLPYIGTLALIDVCNEALESFKDDRLEDGAKASTVNRSLEVVRTVMNRAARVWRSGGKPWLASSPLIASTSIQRSISGYAFRSTASDSASARGLALRGLASCMATVTARSPWAACLGDSKVGVRGWSGASCATARASASCSSALAWIMSGF